MDELMRYAASLEDADLRSLPPVEKWAPAFSGEIDIVIQRDGTWLHEGAPIKRARLVRLFSTILRREGDEYFLVTPAEKRRIVVEDAPFLAVRMQAKGRGDSQTLSFQTNLGDEVTAGAAHPIYYRMSSEKSGKAPYLLVRGGLEARIARPVFYELVERGVERQIEGKDVFGVVSAGEFFPFVNVDALQGEE